MVMALQKNVTMIAMYHTDETKNVTCRGREKIKPMCVLDNNTWEGLI
jgi:hypothetical protein